MKTKFFDSLWDVGGLDLDVELMNRLNDYVEKLAEPDEDLQKIIQAASANYEKRKENMILLNMHRAVIFRKLLEARKNEKHYLYALNFYANPEYYELFDNVKDIETDAVHFIDLDHGDIAKETLMKVGKYNEKI